jgi:hypothetical protein
MTPRRTAGAAIALVLTASLGLLAGGCTSPEAPIPIRLDGSTLTVENRTPDDWQNVEVWVNDHYRVTKASMAAGERFAVPLNAFVAGFGQRFDPKRQVVQGVEVTARSRAGAPVKLVHGRGRRQ